MTRQLFNMVGMKYAKTMHIVSRLRHGDRLWLKREPENGHDPYAIVIYDEANRRLAYVKSDPAQQQLARTMDVTGRREIEARYAVTPDRWPQVEVDI